MPVPSFTIPYNSLFLGGGFELPLPQVNGSALETVAAVSVVGRNQLA